MEARPTDTRVHPTAVVEPGAQLGPGVEVGPLAYVGPQVVLGSGTKVHHHGSVEGQTVVGADCQVYPHACLGARTQDLKFRGGRTGLVIGDRNTFREYVTVHCATADGDTTRIGSDNSFLADCHIAHDCVLGNHIVMSNGVLIAGHVTVEDHAVIGGYAAVHQFCRVGAHSMLGAMSKMVRDLPPFFIADGNPCVIRAYNKVGLERSQFTREQLDRVRRIFRILYYEGQNRTQALETLATHAESTTNEFQRVLTFAGLSQRGMMDGVRA